MTPCKQSAFMLFILSWIDVSEAGCYNYFTDTEDWEEYLREPVDYVNLPNKNDSIRCTLQINSIPDKEKDIFKTILQQCYKEEKKPNNTMCREHTIYQISYYHFMCWTASALNVQSTDCYPGDVCLDRGSATTIPPTTTTTVPGRTSTAPPPTPTVPGRTSTAPTPTVNALYSREDPVNSDKSTVSLLSISLILNGVLLLLVIYLCQRRKKLTVEILSEPTSPQAGLMANEAPVCSSTNTHSLLNGNDCAVNEILP